MMELVTGGSGRREIRLCRRSSVPPLFILGQRAGESHIAGQAEILYCHNAALG